MLDTRRCTTSGSLASLKRGSPDARPICVASILVRCWHRSLLPDMPQPHPQACGEKGVVKSCGDWTATEGTCGMEVDLTKAFDNVSHQAAWRALLFMGTPPQVAASIWMSWRAPRFCNVGGRIAEAIWQKKGIPAGDPLSCRILSLLLTPWHYLVEAIPMARSYSYVDDRSAKCQSLEALDQVV